MPRTPVILPRATAPVIAEILESRRLMCAIHSETDVLPGPLPSNSLSDGQIDHAADYYVAEATVSLDNAAGALGETPTFDVNAAGLPLLTSRADGQGLKVFLDFDGHGTNLPFSTDGNTATFNTAEQTAIYYTWRDMVSYFSPLNVNITTVQPPTGGSNPQFAWHLTSNSISGGYAYVGVLTNSQPYGFNQGSNAVSRRSGIAHEIGHLLNLQHQSEYDQWGSKTSEYSDGWDNRSRTVIGIDYNQNIRQWFYGRSASGPSVLQDDLLVMANKVKTQTGGDGFRPDDFGNTIAAASTLPTDGRVEGFIERYSDADVFSLNVTADSRFLIDATPTYESAIEPKIELLDAAGNVVAAKDDADQRTSNNNNDVEFSLDLTAGRYYVRVASSGDISELGEYTLTAAPLMTGFRTQDIGNIYRGGTAAFDPVNNSLIQMAGGTGTVSTSDEFRFTYAPLNGDGSIVIKVDDLGAIATESKLGIMFRQSLTTNSQHVTLSQRSDGAIAWFSRSTAGGSTTTNASSTAALGAWLKLTRSGNDFTAQSSADGETWTNLGGTITLGMPATVFAGVATMSSSSRYVTYARAGNLTFTGDFSSTSPTYNALSAPENLSASPAAGANTSIVLSWTDAQGETGYLIERSADGVNFTTLATIAANLTSYTDTNPWGSMRWFYRISSRDGATNSVPSSIASAVNKPNAPADPASSYARKFTSNSSSAIYLNWKDVSGDQGYMIERSTDGVNYTLLTTTNPNYNAYNATGLTAGTQYTFRISPVTTIGDAVTVPYTIIASTRLPAITGLAFSNKAANSLSLNWNDVSGETGYRVERGTDGTNFSSIATLPANTTSWSDTSVSPLSKYYYRIFGTTGLTQSLNGNAIFTATPAADPLPVGWASGDIGTVSGTGAAGVSGGSWTLLGAGSGIGSSQDNFRYAYRTLSGDGEIIARVASLESVGTPKSGIMIRESLASNSKYAFAYVTPSAGVDFEYRANTGSSATRVDGPASTAPYWVKLNRAGNVLTAYCSADGTAWTQMGQVTISMAGNLYIGLALASGSSSLMTRSTYDNVTLTGATTNVGPVLSTPAYASPSPVTGTTATLNVIATDDGGAANLSYAWATISTPADVPAPVIASTSSSSTGVTFAAPGSYAFRVTITDAQGNFIHSDANVQVNATAATIEITPDGTSVNPGVLVAFTASVRDQFGNLLTGQSQLTWTASRGTINSTGFWTAPATSGHVTITASNGRGVSGGNGGQNVSGTANLIVNLVASPNSFSVDANPQSVRFTLNGDLDITSLSGDDLLLTDLDSQTALPAASIVPAYDALTRQVSFTFPSLPNSALPDGNYRATLSPGGLADTNGVSLDSSGSMEFFILSGDATHDRMVDTADFNILAGNFGAGASVFSQGDFNYDQDVSSIDFAILLSQFGKRLAPPAGAIIAPGGELFAGSDNDDGEPERTIRLV